MCMAVGEVVYDLPDGPVFIFSVELLIRKARNCAKQCVRGLLQDPETQGLDANVEISGLWKRPSRMIGWDLRHDVT